MDKVGGNSPVSAAGMRGRASAAGLCLRPDGLPEIHFGNGWKTGTDHNFNRLYSLILKCFFSSFARRKILIVDCGNSFDPYRLAGLVKETMLRGPSGGGRFGYRAAAGNILDGILVSRMFTAHQLKTKLSALFSGTASQDVSEDGIRKVPGASAAGPVKDAILILHNMDRLIYDYYATAESSPYAVNDGVIEDIFTLIGGLCLPAVVTAEGKYFCNALIPQEIFNLTSR